MEQALVYKEQYARAWTLTKPSKASALKCLEELCKHLPESDYAAEAQYRSLLRYFQATPSKKAPKSLPEWASLFRSEEVFKRAAITEMHISDGRLESTNGHICIQVPGYADHDDGYYSHELLPISKSEKFPFFNPILDGGERHPEIRFQGLESCEVQTLEAGRLSGVEKTGLIFRIGNKWIQKQYLDAVLAGSKLTSLEFRGDADPLGALYFFGVRQDPSSLSRIRGAAMPIRYES